MTPEEWTKITNDVTQEMTRFAQRYSAPIIMSKEAGSGVAWGSGTYIRSGGKTWLLTAEHVVSDTPKDGRLAHLPRDGGQFASPFGKPEMAGWPIDAAALPIYPKEEFLPEPERVLDEDSIAESYSPVDGELLFIYGFPGYTNERNDPRMPDKLKRSRFGHLETLGKPVLTNEIPASEITHASFDPTHHFAVGYPTVGPSATTGHLRPLPNPSGMSGCAIWDTRFIECIEMGIAWRPQYALLCGVAWAALDAPDVILATKIEHVRTALKAVF